MILDEIDKSVTHQLAITAFLQTAKKNVADYPAYQAFPFAHLKFISELAMQHIEDLKRAYIDLPAMFELSRYVLQCAIQSFCATDLCKQYFQELLGVEDLSGQLKFVNKRLAEIVRGEYARSDNTQLSSVNGIAELLEIYLELAGLIEKLDDALYKCSIRAWKVAIYDPTCRGKSNDRRFIVHFFDSSCRVLQSFNPISCSLISKKCNVSYCGRGYGFLYNPLPLDFICMSPSDISYVSETYEYKEDQVANLLALLNNELRLPEQFIKLQHCGNDVLTMYPLKDFEERTPSCKYNEILIRGDAVPSAVFVFKDRFEELKDRVLVWSSAMDLPVVIYDRDKDEVQYIDKLRVKCDTDLIW